MYLINKCFIRYNVKKKIKTIFNFCKLNNACYSTKLVKNYCKIIIS